MVSWNVCEYVHDRLLSIKPTHLSQVAVFTRLLWWTIHHWFYSFFHFYSGPWSRLWCNDGESQICSNPELQKSLADIEYQVWCWIREEWASIRLFTSYFFVWVCIAASIILNTIVGCRLFRTRNRVQHISNSRSGNSAADNPTVLYLCL